MSNIKIDELQKLYDDPKVDPFLQDICEYYSTLQDYESISFQDEIEPALLVESVYMLFCLQKREWILDQFEYIHKKYPNLFMTVSDFYNTILTNMNYTELESKYEHQIVEEIPGISSADIYDEIGSICQRNDNLSECMERFYKWLDSKQALDTK